MTVDEKIEEIVKEYHCNELTGEGCWSQECNGCENELREDLLELVEIVKARDEELKSMIQTQDNCYKAGREDMLHDCYDWLNINRTKYNISFLVSERMTRDLGKGYSWIIT